MFNGLNADGRCNMAFARSGTTDEHDVLSIFHKIASVQLPGSGLIDVAGLEVKASKVAI